MSTETTPTAAPKAAKVPTTLEALAKNKGEGVEAAKIHRVNPNLITFEDGFNLREDNDETKLHVERLYKAMKQGAFIPPVDVQINAEGVIVARDGHCRTRAAIKLVKEMPEYTLEVRQLRGNEADAVLHMLGTGGGSKPLTPLEQGRGYLRLINMGMKVPAIASKLGVSRVTVDNGLTLVEASPEVQQMISGGEVSSTTARNAIKDGPEAIAALVSAVKAERAKPAAETTATTGTEAGGTEGKKPTKKAAAAAKKAAKKKVTAKSLKGTAADKGKKKSAKQLAAEAEQAAILSGPSVAGNGPPEVEKPEGTTATEAPATQPYGVLKSDDPDAVTIVIKKGTAKLVAEFLRNFGGEDADNIAVANAFDMALM